MDRETFKKAQKIDDDIKHCERAKKDLEAKCGIFLERGELNTTNLSFDKGLRDIMIDFFKNEISRLEEELNQL